MSIYCTHESYPGQHLEMRARELLNELIAGPMAVRGMDGKERDFCEEQAIQIILDAFRTHDAHASRGSKTEEK